MSLVKIFQRKVNVVLGQSKYRVVIRPAANILIGGDGGGGGGPVYWNDVQNKPNTFPPSAHTHSIDDVIDLQDLLDNMQDNIDGKQPALDFTPENTANKGQPGGYASLDGAGLIPESQLPSIAIDVVFVDRIFSLPVTGEEGKIYVTKNESREFWWNGSAYVEIEPAPHAHDMDDVTGLQDALDGKQAALGFTPEDTANKDVAGGYAGLDGSGKINPSQLPSIAITERFVVNSQAAMLALTAQTGDIAIRTDINRTFILSGDPTVLANWAEALSPTDAVTSVFGRSGVVTAQNGDYNSDQVTEGSGNLYFTGARAVGAALTGYAVAGAWTAITATDTVLQAFGKIARRLADLAAVAFSGSASDLSAGTLPAARFDDTTHGSRAGGSLHANATTSVAGFMSAADKTKLDGIGVAVQSIIIAVGDEVTALTAGTAKVTFRMPYAFTLTAIRASLTTAQPSGSILTVDVNENGTSILSTKLTIDNTEKTSTTAVTAAVISDPNLADDAEITIDIDQFGTSGAAGLKVALIGYRL